MLGTKKLIRSLRLTNFLSFGPVSQEIPLESLNVLVGPNAAGKSNLIEAIDFLRMSHKDLLYPIRQGGGIEERLWKGVADIPVAEIDATVFYPSGIMPLRHKIAFTMRGQRFELVDEAVENEHPEAANLSDVRFYYRFYSGRPVISAYPDTPDSSGSNRSERRLRREDIALDQSILSQRREPDLYPEITYPANQYANIRIYRDWNLGRYTPPRIPQKADMPEDFLLEDTWKPGPCYQSPGASGRLGPGERSKRYYLGRKVQAGCVVCGQCLLLAGSENYGDDDLEDLEA